MVNPYEEPDKHEKEPKKKNKIEGVAKEIINDRKKRSNTVRNPKIRDDADTAEIESKKKKGGKDDCRIF